MNKPSRRYRQNTKPFPAFDPFYRILRSAEPRHLILDIWHIIRHIDFKCNTTRARINLDWADHRAAGAGGSPRSTGWAADLILWREVLQTDGTRALLSSVLPTDFAEGASLTW
jgi:hypothetical protein